MHKAVDLKKNKTSYYSKHRKNKFKIDLRNVISQYWNKQLGNFIILPQ